MKRLFDKLKPKYLKALKNVILILAIMAVCTAVSMFFIRMGMNESSIVMFFLLGILLFSYLAEGYLYSIFASVFSVLLFNFFFTEPYYTFLAYNPDSPITFLVLFTVGIFTSMLTIRVKKETQLAEERESRIKALYHIGKRLLEVKTIANLAVVSADEISKQFGSDVLVQFNDSAGNLMCRYIKGNDVFDTEEEQFACSAALKSAYPSEAKAFYMPVISQSGVLGVIGISPADAGGITGNQKEFLNTIAPQIAAVTERERLYQKQKETQIEVQRERLRADILRTISHDLRTPLTGIMGLASTAISNYETLDDGVKRNFLRNIYDDAGWLNQLVDNILETTRFDEGKVKLNISEEAAEEIVAEAIGHVRERASGYRIMTSIPDKIILLQADGVLIRQVLVNLIGNALNYSPEGSEITVSTWERNRRVFFKVSDNGPGIPEQELPHVFERFYSRSDNSHGARKGMGIGLSLCKSIVEAHEGKIFIRNNEPHGTAAVFYIPTRGDDKNAASDPDS
jgi:two-component system sensor histidine kinase KdpD